LLRGSLSPPPPLNGGGRVIEGGCRTWHIKYRRAGRFLEGPESAATLQRSIDEVQAKVQAGHSDTFQSPSPFTHAHHFAVRQARVLCPKISRPIALCWLPGM
jgi:hypothetical protein